MLRIVVHMSDNYNKPCKPRGNRRNRLISPPIRLSIPNLVFKIFPFSIILRISMMKIGTQIIYLRFLDILAACRNNTLYNSGFLGHPIVQFHMQFSLQFPLERVFLLKFIGSAPSSNMSSRIL